MSDITRFLAVKNRCFLLVSLILLLRLQPLAGVVTGNVTDILGEPLPFATVYAKGTTLGTATNPEGVYELQLPEGNYDIVFQYIGYKKAVFPINITHKKLVLNVVLEPEQILLSEVEISSSAEDPAYAIIRKAIAKREFHLKQVDRYVCKAYTKGIFRVTEAPDKMFGEELNTQQDSILGIVYLSESESRISFEQPGKTKEEMISSKVSGDDQGFGINFISFFLTNFYENKTFIPFDDSDRGFINPIANNALFYYNYRLEGNFIDDSLLIHKIRVIPKRRIDPAFSGYIYIIDGTWRIHSVDLVISKEAQINFIDSIKITKTHVPVYDSLWMSLTQKLQFYFSINFFGKKFAGNGVFHSQFTSYVFDTVFPKDYFKNEIIKVDPIANKKDSLFWEENRPIPLTSEEIRNYRKEDSLEIIRESDSYLDSIREGANKVKWGDLWNGYSYYNHKDSARYSIGSPISTIQFNTVQGLNLYLRTSFSKLFQNKHRFSASQTLSYGFSNKRWGYVLSTYYRFNPNWNSRVFLSGGVAPVQYNGNRPISQLLNTFYTLLDENNYMKLYQKSYVSAGINSEILNGLFTQAAVEYADRKALTNTSTYKWVSVPSREFTSNNPLSPANDAPAFEQHQAFILSVSLRYKIKQQYISVPDRQIIGSRYPELVFQYRKALNGVLDSDVNYDFVSLGLEGNIKLGFWGKSNYQAEYGVFTNNSVMEFIDFQHFRGNRTIIGSPVLNSFQLLDYYKHSTNKTYFEAGFEHHFNGFIFNKIPFVRKTKWRALAGIRYLNADYETNYFEINMGIENIFRFLRIDFVTAIQNNEKVRTGMVIMVPFNN